jgi:hypothetical protein
MQVLAPIAYCSLFDGFPTPLQPSRFAQSSMQRNSFGSGIILLVIYAEEVFSYSFVNFMLDLV